MNREIVRGSAWPEVAKKDELDLVSLATVFVSSEQARFPIDNVFDGQRGPGGSCWIAGSAGEQTVTLTFAKPQNVRQVNIESEEHGRTRTQEIGLFVSSDGGETYHEQAQREFHFSPYGATFEREEWTLSASAVTHLQLRIAPDKLDKATETNALDRINKSVTFSQVRKPNQLSLASLTSLIVR